MDPVSITTSVGLALKISYQVGHGIYAFRKGVSGIDESVRDLELQVQGLGHILETLTEIIKSGHNLSSPHMSSIKDNLLVELNQTINSCLETLTNLGQLVAKLRNTGQQSSFKQNWRTLKKSWYQSEIDQFGARLRTHSMNLQLAVGALTLYAILTLPSHNKQHQDPNNLTRSRVMSTPDTQIHEQNEMIDKLDLMLTILEQRLNPSINASGVSRSTHLYLAQIKPDNNTISIKTCAAAILTSASTVTGRSSSGATVLANDVQVFEYIDSPMNNTIFAANGASTTGSEYGVPLNPLKRSQMHDWLQNTLIPETFPEAASPKESTPSTAWSSSMDVTQTLSTNMSSLELFHESSDEEGELDLEVARNIFRKADAKLNIDNNIEAQKLYQEGFKLALDLGPKAQEMLDLRRIKLRYANACCFTDQFPTAEKLYVQIMEQDPIDAAALETILTAGHYLSIAKLRQSDFKAAKDYCRDTLKRKQKARSIGRTHSSYRLTLRLLSITLWAQGERELAEHYAEMLPVNERPDLEKELALLIGPGNIAKQWPPVSPVETERGLESEPRNCLQTIARNHISQLGSSSDTTQLEANLDIASLAPDTPQLPKNAGCGTIKNLESTVENNLFGSDCGNHSVQHETNPSTAPTTLDQSQLMKKRKMTESSLPQYSQIYTQDRLSQLESSSEIIQPEPTFSRSPNAPGRIPAGVRETAESSLPIRSVPQPKNSFQLESNKDTTEPAQISNTDSTTLDLQLAGVRKMLLRPFCKGLTKAELAEIQVGLTQDIAANMTTTELNQVRNSMTAPISRRLSLSEYVEIDKIANQELERVGVVKFPLSSVEISKIRLEVVKSFLESKKLRR